MSTIKGIEYSDTRINEDGDKEFYIDDWNGWFTVEEVKEEKEEQRYWTEDFPDEEGHDND